MGSDVGPDQPRHQNGKVHRVMDKPLETYRNHEIVDDHGTVTVINPAGDRYIVALDDSKLNGNRCMIPEANNVETARKYIDWVTDKPAPGEARSILTQCAKKAHDFARGRTVKNGEFVIVKRSCLLELVMELRNLSKRLKGE